MLRFRHVLCVTAFGVLCSCSDDGTLPQSEDSSTGNVDSTGAVSMTASTGTAGMSSTSATTSATSDDATLSASDSGGTADSGGFINPESEDSGPDGPQPNGGGCANNEGCESGFCYAIPQIGGVCSECLVDSDCEAGTCAVDFAAMYAVCTDGSIGNMCNSDEGCAGDLVCTELIDTGGLFNASFCSECGPTAPCAGDLVCAPMYDAAAFTGHFTCVEAASVPNGGGCPIADGVGDGAPCASGMCGVADVFMGLVQLGVCGECLTDDDCEAKMTCVPANVDMNGLMGAACQ